MHPGGESTVVSDDSQFHLNRLNYACIRHTSNPACDQNTGSSPTGEDTAESVLWKGDVSEKENASRQQ
jgi:hypothetical protein